MNIEQRKVQGAIEASAPQKDVSNEGQIVFVGSDQRFSDTFLRTVQFEIPHLETRRYYSLSHLRESFAQSHQRLWLVVLDARLLKDVTDIAGFVDNLRHDLHVADRHAPQVALACETDSCRSLERGAAVKLLKDHRSVEGFRGVLPLSRPVDVWLEILRLFLSRGSYYPPELFSSLLDEGTGAGGREAVNTRAQISRVGQVTKRLTRRENEVLAMVAEGLQNKQIAADLSLSEHTVKLHIHNVISKLDVKNRTEAAAMFLSSAAPL